MTASEKRSRHFSRPGGFVLGGCGLAAFFGTFLWVFECWQRPAGLAGVGDGWWLIVAWVGAAGVLWGVGSRLKPRWRWLAVLAAAGLALIQLVARHAAMDLAVNNLIAGLTAVDSTQSSDSRFDAIRSSLGEWLENRGWPSGWLGRPHEHRGWKGELSWACHRIEASRPDLRRRLALATMRESADRWNLDRMAVRHWQWLFPVVTGQDVTLNQRRLLWEDLRRLHDDTREEPDSRMAAALWMALIVLSDTEAFADRRIVARDALFAWDDPPRGALGDVWMRALDLLLAFDSEAEQARLTAPQAARPEWLRRAVRERVRAVRSHLDAAVAEIRRADAADEPGAALALWADVRGFAASLEMGPAGRRLTATLHQMLAGWLLRDDFAPEIMMTHRFSDDNYETGFWEWVAVETADDLDRNLLDAETLVRLGDRARALLARLQKSRARHLDPGAQPPPDAKTWLPDLDRLLVLRTLAAPPERDDLTRRLGDLMVDLAWLRDENCPQPDKIQCLGHDGMLRRLAAIWPLIRPADRVRFSQVARPALSQSMRSWGRGGYSSNFFRGWVVAMDTASESQQFSPLECLVACMDCGGYLTFHKADGKAAFPLQQGRRLFPDISGPALESAIAELVAMTNKVGKGGAEGRPSRQIVKLRGEMRRSHGQTLTQEGVARRVLLEKGLIRRGEGDALNIDEWVRAYLGRDDLFKWAAESPSNARELLTSQAADDEIVGGFAAWLIANPPADGVAREVVGFLESATASEHPKRAFAAHGALLRLATAGIAPGPDRVRARMLESFQTRQPALEDWPGESYRPDGTGGWVPQSRWGEQVPWADDGLAAMFAWSSQIKRELGELGHSFNRPSRGPVFLYLSVGLDFTLPRWDYGGQSYHPELVTPVRSGRRRGGPPALPLAPTPWQRARELHQRRPDLEFPDRVRLRREFEKQ